MRSQLVKRVLDLTVGCVGLLVAAPLMVFIGAAILLTAGWPILYRQKRPGLHGQPFEILKFRTMRNAFDGEGQPLPDRERLTWFGTLLRNSSMDELPELLNVLRGEMSLVGPRPLLMRYLERYTPEQARRHEVKPGITGLAQINGRNALSWEDKFKFDVWYVDHQSLLLDLKILLLTVWKVLIREGISEQGHATMSEFMGPENYAKRR